MWPPLNGDAGTRGEPLLNAPLGRYGRPIGGATRSSATRRSVAVGRRNTRANPVVIKPRPKTVRVYGFGFHRGNSIRFTFAAPLTGFRDSL